jgi:4-amino-4-deoxy-L-arabinose transferase-like glycosyltransferase
MTQSGEGTRPLSWTINVLVLVLLVGVWFATLGGSLLTEPDEARYAEIPREMLVYGDWITPRLDGIVYFEKPPLQYWITAAAYSVFGVHPWVSKLWTWIASWLGILLVGFAGARLFGRRAGVLGALVLASSPLYFAVGHINTLDSGLTFFMAAALVTFLLSRQSATGSSQRRWWMLAAWAAMALGVLSKGPVALLIPAGSLIGYFALTRDRSSLEGLEPVLGPALLLLICAPWFILVSSRNPGFARFFFIHEHVERFLTNEHGRVKPWWFFVVLLLVGMIPWIGAVLRGWYRSLAGPAGPGFAVEKFLGVYALVVLGFFSASGSKLAPYLDPIIPPLALLGAAAIDRLPERRIRLTPLLMFVGAGLLLVAIPVLMAKIHAGPEFPETQRFVPWVFVTAAVWAIGAAVGVILARRARPLYSCVAVAAGLVLGLQFMFLGLREYSQTRSAAAVTAALREQLGSGSTTIYSIGGYLQGIPFDLRRPVTVVGRQGDLEVQLEPRSPNWIPSLEAFAVRWNAETHPVAVVDKGAWAAVARLRLPMETFYSDGQTVLVRKNTRLSADDGRTADGAMTAVERHASQE